MKKVNFADQEIYVGIDVHLKQWNVGIFTEKSFHKAFQQPPSAEVLSAYLKRHFPGAKYHTVYEAGLTGFSTHWDLLEAGLNSMVVHAADVPTKDKERKQKRDKVDARKLGRGLRSEDLKAIYVPSLEVQQDRELIRYRCNKLMPKITRIKNQIKSFLNLYGYQPKSAVQSWTKAYLAWVADLKFANPSARQALDHLLDELAFYKQRLKRVNRQIVELSRQDRYKERVKLLRSAPGIGLMIAMVILTEIDDMSRFNSLDKLCHYVGIVPTVHASADKEYIGPQTRRGNALLRRMLIQSAWTAKRLDPAMLLKFDTLTKEGMKKNKAIIRIAKKLLNRIRRMMLTGEPYQLGVN